MYCVVGLLTRAGVRLEVGGGAEAKARDELLLDDTGFLRTIVSKEVNSLVGKSLNGTPPFSSLPSPRGARCG